MIDKSDLEKLTPQEWKITFINEKGQAVSDTFYSWRSDGTLETAKWYGIRPEKVIAISKLEPNDLR